MKTEVNDVAFDKAEGMIAGWIKKCESFKDSVDLDEEGRFSLIRILALVIEAEDLEVSTNDSVERHFLVTNQAYQLLEFWQAGAKENGRRVEFGEVARGRLVRLIRPFLAKVTPTSFYALITNPSGKPE